VYESLNAVKLGLDQNMRDKMYFVDYNDMVSNPEQVMEDIYDFLGEEHYEHTFDGLSNVHRENDLNTYGLGDMHEVHSKLEKTSSSPEFVLPEEIIDLYEQNKQSLEFWNSK
jgi:sulfotransferase